jgi:D-galacturonate reductase
MTESRRPLDVLVVGAGMYVSGAGTEGFGTVMPSLAQASRSGLVGAVTIAATRGDQANAVLKSAAGVQELLGTRLPVAYEPSGGVRDPHAYLKAAERGHFDCAIVSVPDELHFEITRELMTRGLHCLVVKPLVPTVAELDELIRIAASHGVYGAVEFHKRFDESNLKAKRLLHEGAIGDVLYAHVEFSQRRTVPLEHFATWAARTNIFQYLGVHYADLIWFCTGAIPRRVMATGQKNLLLSRGIDTWDAVQAMIEWSAPRGGTFVSTILTNWVDPPAKSAMSDQMIKWFGTLGRIECEQKDRGLSLINDRGVQHVNPYFSDLLHDADGQLHFGGYGHRSIEQFLTDVSRIASGEVVPEQLRGGRATFEDARVSTIVVEAANASLAAGGTWIETVLRGGQ